MKERVWIFVLAIGLGMSVPITVNYLTDTEQACPSGITVERIEQNGVTCWVASDGKGHISMDCQ